MGEVCGYVAGDVSAWVCCPAVFWKCLDAPLCVSDMLIRSCFQ